MRLSSRFVQSFIIFGIGFLFLSPSASWSQDFLDGKRKEMQVSLGVNPYGTLYAVGAEIETGAKASILVRAGGFSYSYEEEGYTEDGGGSIIGVYGKFYSEELMDGMYFGFGIDRVSASVSWWEYQYSGSMYGTTEAKGFAPGVMIGNKMDRGEMTIEPNLFISMLPGELETSTLFALGITVGFPLK